MKLVAIGRSFNDLCTEWCLDVSGVDLIVVPTPKFPLEWGQMAAITGTARKYELGMTFLHERSKRRVGNSFGATFKRSGTVGWLMDTLLGSPRVLRRWLGWC